MKTSILFFALCLPAAAGCFPVAGDFITGRDLAIADTRFAPVPATFVAFPAPQPGAARILGFAELSRIARANAIQLNGDTELCFAVPLRQLGTEEIATAIRISLSGKSGSSAQFSIVERSTAPVPEGKVEFPLSGLNPPSPSEPGVQLWRGYVRQSESRRTNIWARVTISQTLTAVVAVRDLPLNLPVDASALRVTQWTGPILHEAVALRPEDAIGHLPKKIVKAGALIPVSILEQPLAIHKGDAVKVEVQCGPARLQLDAIAEREGRDGEMVELRNPSSGKIFRARLEGSKAVVLIGTGSKL